MDTNNEPIDFLRHAVACLNESSLALLDFDTLRDQLASLIVYLESCERQTEQYALLRADYQQRIAGMIKAIAAVDRKHGSLEDALAQIDGLERLTTSDLIGEYRRVSAAFRGVFPTTFHPLPVRARSVCGVTLSERRHPEPAAP